MFQRKKIDMDIERNIVIGMIIDDIFLRDVVLILKDDTSLFKSSYYKIIANWCVDYYKSYEKSPKDIIFNIFESKKSDMRSESDIEYIEDVLNYLTDNYNKDNSFNRDYFFDQSEKYLKKRSLEKLVSEIQTSIIDGDLISAESKLSNYERVEKPMGTGIDLFNDRSAIIDCFMDGDDYLLKISGDLGNLMKEFYRGDLISFGAPQKRGKTFYLLWFAMICALSGLKVVYWTLEMRGRLMVKRTLQMLLGETKYEKNDVVIPFFDKDNNIKYKILPNKKGVSLKDSLRIQKGLKKQIRTGGFRMMDSSNAGCNVASMANTLDNLEYYDNFLADVVVADYLDICDPEPGSPKEYRHSLDYTWKAAKKLAEKRSLLFVTASQVGKIGHTQDVDASNAAEDIRKYSHVSHWINLNQSKIEKALKIMRISVSGRHDDFNPLDQVVVLECRDIGRPVIDSRYLRDIPGYYEWLKEKSIEMKGV